MKPSLSRPNKESNSSSWQSYEGMPRPNKKSSSSSWQSYKGMPRPNKKSTSCSWQASRGATAGQDPTRRAAGAFGKAPRGAGGAAIGNCSAKRGAGEENSPRGKGRSQTMRARCTVVWSTLGANICPEPSQGDPTSSSSQGKGGIPCCQHHLCLYHGPTHGWAATPTNPCAHVQHSTSTEVHGAQPILAQLSQHGKTADTGGDDGPQGAAVRLRAAAEGREAALMEKSRAVLGEQPWRKLPLHRLCPTG
jgi:hypothetical protein